MTLTCLHFTNKKSQCGGNAGSLRVDVKGPLVVALAIQLVEEEIFASLNSSALQSIQIAFILLPEVSSTTDHSSFVCLAIIASKPGNV